MEKKTLIRWIIEQVDGRAYRRGSLSGEKHFQVDAALFRELGGRAELLRQAEEIEQDTIFGKSGGIRVDWRDMGASISTIHCPVNVIPELCRREDMEDPRLKQLRYIGVLESWKEKAGNSWLAGYYEKELANLLEGRLTQTMADTIEDGYLFRVLDAVYSLEEPIEKPVFSARVFKNVKMHIRGRYVPPSKIFREKYERKVISILQNYSPRYVEGMEDDEVLQVHGIVNYTPTLQWKGALTYLLNNIEVAEDFYAACSIAEDVPDDTGAGEIQIDTSCNRYGTIIGTQTLERGVVKELSGVKRIIVIENKAVYERMQFRADELYIFCHGFFSPKEVRFLKGITEASEDGTEYYHWGDMDYGGIRIFQFNKTHIFPQIRPYRMGREDYKKAVAAGAGVAIEAKKRKKLEKLDAGELEELKECILEYGLEIEQELLV